MDENLNALIDYRNFKVKLFCKKNNTNNLQIIDRNILQ